MVIGTVAFMGFVGNTIVQCLILYVFALLKLLMPIRSVRAALSRVIVGVAEFWITINNINSDLTQYMEWDVKIDAELDPKSSYLVLCNHRTWVDIYVLQRVFNRKIPFLRFFIKRELMWIPLLGLAWWALDFPFVKRHSKEFIAKYPEKKGQDLERTRRFCEKLKSSPTSILNFVEGTRFTEDKHARGDSPYKYLMPAKTGGVATVLDVMGDRFKEVLDVTIIYPKGVKSFLSLFYREIPSIKVRVRSIPVPMELVGSDKYEELKSWVNEIWREKDQLIGREMALS